MSIDQIYPIPPVPPGIVEAVNNRRLAVFVGAGVSRILGCKGWDELAKDLVKECIKITKKDGFCYLDYRSIEILSQYTDHTKTITICYEIMKENGLEDVFFDVLKKSFKLDEKQVLYRDIYHQIYGLRGLCITTNADDHFDELFLPDRIIYKNFSPDDIDPTKLYHIHGSILDRDSLIFTIPQYINHYNDDKFKEFLKWIFARYVVLFVGYGMSEFELLDFIIMKYDDTKGKESKHFILLPFYTGEESRLEFEQKYHNLMGISVVAYRKDLNGWNQLWNVIKDWNDKVNQTSTYLIDSFKEIEEAVDNYGK